MDAFLCNSNTSCAVSNQSTVFSVDQGIYPVTPLDSNTSSERIATTEGVSAAGNTTMTQNTTNNHPIAVSFATNVTTDEPLNITEAMLTLVAVTFEERIIESTFMALITLIGIPANILLMLTLFYNKRFRKPLHSMLFCISLFDFCTVCAGAPLPYILIKNEWELGRLACDTIALIQASGISITLMTHALVAINCYFKSKFRSNIAHILSNSRAVITSLLFFIVLVALLVIVPHLTGYIYADYAPILGICVSAWTADDVQNIETYIYIHFTVCSIVPYAICIFAYTKVLYVIWKRQDIFENNIIKRQFVNACKRMGVLFIAFSICYLPFTIYTLADPYLITVPTWGIRTLLIIFLSHVVVNPLICLISLSDINKGLRDMLSGAPRKLETGNSSVHRNTWEPQKNTSKSIAKATHSNTSLSSGHVSGGEPPVTSWM